MAGWIKRRKIGNRTYTTNTRTGGVRVTTTTKRNKNSNGPTVSLSHSTKGKSYRTETYKSGLGVKRTRTTLFKTPRVKTSKIKITTISGGGSGRRYKPKGTKAVYS